MTSNLPPPLPWRNPFVTPPPPRRLLSALPPPRPGFACSLRADGTHTYSRPSWSRRWQGRGTLWVLWSCPEAPLSLRLRTGSEQLSGAEARTRSTLGVVVPASESPQSLRVRTGIGQASVTGVGVKVTGIPGLSASLFGYTCFRSPVSQPGSRSGGVTPSPAATHLRWNAIVLVSWFT